jgi:tetratricopeptide (TPR) repeat protein
MCIFFLIFFFLCVYQGSYADAIACYTEVLRIDPTAADALVNRGNTFKEFGRVAEAIQDYVQAVTIRPTMAEAHANLASAYKDRYYSVFSNQDNLQFWYNHLVFILALCF